MLDWFHALMPKEDRAIATQEEAADAITREVLLAVRRTFITPFDRSDIQNLIDSLDAAIAQMQKTARAVQLFEVAQFDQPMRDMRPALGRAVLPDRHGAREVVGGWRIVHTMGSKITRLSPMQGSHAETSGAITLFPVTALGIPVRRRTRSRGAIVGVGASRRVSAVRWNVAQSIVVAWIVTMPMAGLIGASIYALSGLFVT